MSHGSDYQYDSMTAEEISASLGETVAEALRMRYSSNPDGVIVQRVREEWTAMENSGDLLTVAALYELTAWLKAQREPYWLRGTAGSSFIFYLLGITRGNPLPPHYQCPQCRRVIWRTSYADGFDLPRDLVCEKDEAPLRGDGHNVPWQMNWGYGREPHYEICVTGAQCEKLWAFFENHWLSKFQAEEKPRTRGDDSDPHFFRFSRFSINCVLDADEISSRFYDILPPDASCTDRAAEVLIAVDRAAQKTAKLQLDPKHPFADLIARCGLTHSTGVWDREAQFMVKRLGYTASDLIAHREDVFSYLLSHGFSEKDAWYGMDHVCRGKSLLILSEEMESARDKWVIERCSKIQYLFSKAHALEYIFYSLRANAV